MARIVCKCCFVVLCALFAVTPVLAQQRTDAQKLIELDAIIAQPLASGTTEVDMVSHYVLDSLLSTYQRALSGSQVEAGKVIGTSVSVTDKGAKANIGISRISSTFAQLTVGGEGKDNFISLLQKGKYGNTISIGGQLQVFVSSSGFFMPWQANRLHNRLTLLKASNGTYAGAGATTAYDTRLSVLHTHIQALEAGNNNYESAVNGNVLTPAQQKTVDDYMAAAAALITEGLLKSRFLKDDDLTRQAAIGSLVAGWTSATNGAGPDERRLRYYLKDAEELQLAAEWRAFSFHWLSFSAGYNVTNYQILDSSAKSDDYQNPYYDQFLTVSGSYNYLHTRQWGDQFRFYVSPTISIKTARVFSDDDKLNLARLKAYNIFGDSLTNTDMSTEVFGSIADRKVALSLEIPLVFYWNKRNFGFEISPKAGINDPKGDNVGLRIGAFIPAEVKDGVPVLVEPMIRFQKLFATSGADFLKDNVAIGFNVSVSLPTGLGKIGK